MASGLSEYELEGLGETEAEFENESELESETEFENEFEAPEMFGWGDIKNWTSNQWTALNTPGSWQRKALLTADRAILSDGGGALGKAIGGEPGRILLGGLGKAAASLLPDQEYESEFEWEGEVNPVSKIYPDAMMEHLGHIAMESESEAEAAEGFLPLVPLVASKLVPLAAKALPKIAGRMLPKVAQQVSRVTPRLVRSVTNLTRALHRDPRTRPLLRVVPSVTRRAITTIARRAAAGHPVSPQLAARILARQNHRILSNPRMVRTVLQRSNAMDRRYHHMSGLPRRWLGRRRSYGYQPGMSWTGGPTAPYSPARRAYGSPSRFCPNCGTTTVTASRRNGCSVVVVK
jgi:hypothetical protein